MNASGSSLLSIINVGHWTPRKRLFALGLLFLICALTMAMAAVVVEARLRQDDEITLQQQQNDLLQEALWQAQSQLLGSKQQRVYLGLLETALTGSQEYEQAPDVTYFVNALQNAALLNGWQQLQIGYRELGESMALEVQATVLLLSLSGFWLTLHDSGNLFDIQQLDFKAENRPGLYTVQLQLLPLQAGWLPPSDCQQHCPYPVARQQKQKGFLLRTRNNNEQLTPLTSDALGRLSTAASARSGVSL